MDLDLHTREGLDWIFGEAEMIRATGQPVRWVVFDVDSGRIRLETPRLSVDWLRGSDERLPFRAVFEPRWQVEAADPATIEAWEASDRVYVTAFSTPEGPSSRLWVDAVTSDVALAATWPLVPVTDIDRLRTRREMRRAGRRYRAALRRWEAGDDSALAADARWWADRMLMLRDRYLEGFE